jgi:hypothetical protein
MPNTGAVIDAEWHNAARTNDQYCSLGKFYVSVDVEIWYGLRKANNRGGLRIYWDVAISHGTDWQRRR